MSLFLVTINDNARIVEYSYAEIVILGDNFMRISEKLSIVMLRVLF